MAPTLDDVASIKDLINQLQVRVEQMERSIRSGGQATPVEQLRMILMGPPGAGKKKKSGALTPSAPCPRHYISNLGNCHG